MIGLIAMPMTSRNDSKTEQSNGDSPSAALPATLQTPIPPQSEKRAKSAKNASKKNVAVKKSAKTAATKAAPKRPRRSKPYEPSDADIRLRAYFIAERRVQMALHGDPAKDWLEARRQLLEEAASQGNRF